jgi:hypothetical protein
METAVYDNKGNDSSSEPFNNFTVVASAVYGNNVAGLVGDYDGSTDITVNVSTDLSRPLVLQRLGTGNITVAQTASATFVGGVSVSTAALGDTISIIPTRTVGLFNVKKG